ncbi:MAG: hypothetical protein NTX52_12080 [Planctomycetota bacterium]|nr:hypothetical protein [Planctomycetota bacterium]
MIVKKTAVIVALMVLLLATNWARADICKIVNGSFEDDGYIGDITVKEPNGWDVNVPVGKFKGYIYNKWVTEGSYNLTIYTQWVKLDVNDIAIVSQQIDLTDVNEIIFDVNLATDLFQWDPNKVSAVILIDDDVVWESNDLGSGAYPGQVYEVDNKYRDGNLHTLSFGMRVKVSEKLWRTYYTNWDFIRCTVYCGGGGILVGDFNRDCFVDANDLKLIAELWLDTVEPNDKYNLFHGDDYGTISFLDFAVFADRWDGNIFDLGVLADKWLQTVDANDPDNLFHLDDVAVINFSDLASFADKWLCSSYVEGP